MLIRPATLNDLTYVVSLSKQESHALGFIPKMAYESAVTGIKTGKRWSNVCRDVLLICEENEDPVGFLLGGQGRIGKINQICLQPDARRFERGRALISHYVDASSQNGIQDFGCGCADDLESNQFWEAMGWLLLGQRFGKQDGWRETSDRRVNLYRYQINSLLF